MSEQTAPLPLLILAVVFLIVWNMDPVVEGDNETDHVVKQFDSSSYHSKQSSDTSQKETFVDEEEGETKTTESIQR